MSSTIILLGAVAGLTIFLGLPIGRVRHCPVGVRAFLNAAATGVLIFLLWDVLSQGFGRVEQALTAATGHTGSWAHVLTLAATFAACVTAGLMSLVYYDRWMSRRRGTLPAGPGALAAGELPLGRLGLLSPARRLSMMIAIGIGLHNFSEGLAIGQSAASGALALALVLVVGFGLHNATEGFGIVAPMAAQGDHPSWGFLALLGLVGGGPTALGTILGQSVVSEPLFLGFLALAAGSILYVVVQLLNVAGRLGRRELTMWGILLGLFAGFATDMVLTAAGV